MKALKIVEKVLFLVAVVVVAAALSISLLLDEGGKEPIQGVVTTMLTYIILGAGFVLLLLITGAVLKFAKGEAASKTGEGLVLTAVISVFAISLYLIVTASKASKDAVIPFSALFGLIGGIIYIVYAIIKGIVLIVKAVKPEVNKQDPSNDDRIQAVLKWKELLDKNIITKEEFEEKRIEILEIKKKQPAK